MTKLFDDVNQAHEFLNEQCSKMLQHRYTDKFPGSIPFNGRNATDVILENPQNKLKARFYLATNHFHIS